MNRKMTSNSNNLIVINGIVKSNMGLIGQCEGDPDLFPEDRPKGPLSHAFEAAQRFRSKMETKEEP